MAARCSKWNKCSGYKTVGCNGCGFQHFDRIDDTHNRAIRFLKDEYFRLCAERRKGPGGRIPIDGPFKKLFLTEAKKIVKGFPQLKELQIKELTSTIEIKGQKYKFQVKCDGAFHFSDRKSASKYIFYELKGYGDDTNSILSAITAAQLIGKVATFQQHRYYYIGVGSPLVAARGGLRREHFFLQNRAKVAPYVRWAESKGIIQFYGIRDVIDLLRHIKEYCSA